MSSVRFAVGQNLYIYRMMNRAPNNDWTRAITDWYDEVTLYSNEDVDRWKYHSETGHYTQVKRIFCISNLQVICDPNNINCEAQGKGRAKGRLRKVTQRSLIDYILSIINIFSLELTLNLVVSPSNHHHHFPPRSVLISRIKPIWTR